MRTIALALLAALSGCANPIYHATGSSPDGQRPDPRTQAAMRGAWGGELESWTAGSAAPLDAQQQWLGGSASESFPSGSVAADPRDLGWGSTAPGDRPAATGGARAVAPGSTGAGVTDAFGGDPLAAGDVPVVDVERGSPGSVPGQPLGTVAPMDQPRSVDPSSSRTHMFEQFQRLEEERDGLRQQVAAMQAEFERIQVEAQRRAEVDARQELEASSLRAQVERLEETNRQLVRENEDLAGRLLTAQIRRLEAEKALLEHLIAAEQRAASSGAPGTVGGDTATAGARP